MTPEPPEPNCRGQFDLFTSTSAEDHSYARTLCVDSRNNPICPAFDVCENTVRSILDSDYRSGLHGTWIGRLFAPEAKKWQRANAKRKAARS